MTTPPMATDDRSDSAAGDPTAELPLRHTASLPGMLRPQRHAVPSATTRVVRCRLTATDALGLLMAVCAPFVLWHSVGWPLPHLLASAIKATVALTHGRPRRRGLVDALTVMAWMTWAGLVAMLPRELRGLARCRSTRSEEGCVDRRGLPAHRDEDLSCAAVPDRARLGVVRDDEAIARPDLIEVGHRGHETVSLALCDWPGLQLCGPGAEPALRAWLGALLARDGPYAAEILVAGHALFERLLPEVCLPSVHRLETVDSVLAWLESAAGERARRLEEVDVADANAYRRQCRADPFPLLLALVDAVPDGVQTRWRAAMTTAHRVGVAAVVLSDRSGGALPAGPGGPRLVVADDGVVEQASLVSLANALAGASLFQLDRATAAGLLEPVAAAHNDIDPEPPSDTGAEPHDTGDDAPGAHCALPPERDAAEAIPERRAGVVGRRAPAPIRVRLFGPAHVEAFGEEVKSGLRASAYELLAWYAEHPGGASIEAAADAIWPDASARRGRERFWTALGNLRSRLHGPDNDGVEILVKAGDCYRPDPAVLDIDLWDFEAALSDATRAADRAQAAAALQVAIDAYSGDFCPALGAMWVEPVRQDLHRRALDAHLRLAELYADDLPEAALGALERAIEVDPICEQAYRRLITLQAKLERLDAARRTWRLLQGRLAELDLDPEEPTEQLVHELFPPRPTTTRQPFSTRR